MSQASPEAQVLCQVEADRCITSLKPGLWFHWRNLTEGKNASDKKVGISKNDQQCRKGGNDFVREADVEEGKCYCLYFELCVFLHRACYANNGLFAL